MYAGMNFSDWANAYFGISSVYDMENKLLGLRLSQDGKTISGIKENLEGMLVYKANYKYHGRDKKITARLSSFVCG
ncbi:hypothetical protein GCM10010913_24310 [Paenibacillus aceti]|uniref:Uncharacterized protein n=2 Tax=Paenibacillus aceti TaxID=1820010 RepID=A0ABQ1VVS9_9BACL|nr:hypothetical protein GCM10010913_24310 [Paenibacillus aceti]